MLKFSKETQLNSYDFMLHRLVAKGYCTIGELSTVISCNDVLKYTEILDFIEDREEERQRNNRE
jgi:hypothetical protein